MLHTKNEPKGIDLYIERLQTDLYNRLETIWGEDVIHNSFGRCKRNSVKGKYYAEVYQSGGEYTDVLWDDNVDAVSFFGIDTEIRNQTQRAVGVHLVVFCNLKSIKPNSDDDGGEEIKIDYLNIIGKVLFGFHLKSFQFGIENVLKEYKGSIEQVRNIDNHPVHAFRMNFSLSYNHNFSPILKLK
jgi:hypothetical protein